MKPPQVCLWESHLPGSFEMVKLGDRLRIEKGPWAGYCIKVLKKTDTPKGKFVYGDIKGSYQPTELTA